jgi:site-specific recombinase XerC
MRSSPASERSLSRSAVSAHFRTPWLALQRLAASVEALHPLAVTAKMMSQFAHHMREDALALDIINERLRKVRYVFEVAKGNDELPLNPAQETLGFEGSTTSDAEEDRLPFDLSDLARIFSSPIFTAHERSQGQA